MSTPKQIGSITSHILKLNGLMNQPVRAALAAAPSAQSAPNAPTFTHPLLTPEDFKNTIALYNQHIQKYNARVAADNREIRIYNAEVIAHRRKTSVTREQWLQESLWREEHKELAPADYNAAVEKYNQEHGPQFRKVNLRQPVKPSTERFFIAFLHQYNMQLFKRKSLRTDLGVHVPGQLPKLELYPNKIVDAQRDGYNPLPVSVETVRHHRERLEEAGVLTGYSYHGPNRPIKIAFSTAILSLTDNGIPKKALNENQALTDSQTNLVRHNNVSSREPSSEESKYREKGDLAAARSQTVVTGTSTGTPRKQGGKKTDPPAKNQAGPRKKFTEALDRNELSAILTQTLEDKIDFCRDLAAGKHDHYTAIAPKIAQQEAYYGAMHPDDFRELAIQDIFKFSASLFSRLEVHPGSWVNAYKIWAAEMFMNNFGQQQNKPHLFSRWMKCIETLRQVKKYQNKHTDWTPTYPSLYFDLARTEKDHNSFAYAFRNFRLEEEKVEKFQKRKIQAGKSLRHKTDLEKARTKIGQYMNGHCDLQDVFNYVQHTCNREVYKNLNTLMKKEFEKKMI